MFFIGIDWADQKYDIMILNESGKVISDLITISKSRKDFERFLDRIRKLSPCAQDVKVGIETPHNLIVDFLIELGYSVFALFPGSMKSFRKRYRSSGARDDEFDAFVLADVLRTDTRCWRKVDFGSDLVREIKILVQDHHTLVEQQTALINRLRSTVKEYYPEYVQFFNDVACPSSLAFIQTYPDFQLAKTTTRGQLSAFFKEQNLRNHKKVERIYNILHQKHLQVSEILVRAKKLKAMATVQELLSLTPSVKMYAEQLEQLLKQHPDSEIFLSYPGAGPVTAARLLAFFGDNRKLYVDVSELQALAGTCPVTEKSGKNFKVIYYRVACNKLFRDIMINLAFSSLRQAKWAMAYYQNHKKHGKTHQHALRCLANIHLKILFAMWKSRTKYDENIFLAQRARVLMRPLIIC
jgi:transposase